jgi:hypothetical protein
MYLIAESCHDCGREIPDGLGEPRLARLPGRPATGAEGWGWVQVCPACGTRRQRRRRTVLALVSLLVAALALLVAYPLLS